MTLPLPNCLIYKSDSDRVLGVFTQPLQQNPIIEQHFRSRQIILNPTEKNIESIDLVVGWGRRPKALKASNFATKNNIPYATLEDGFIHSMSQGRLGASSWSLVVDELGIFYDANTPSSLEKLINTIKLSPDQKARAKFSIKTITQHSITKYNNAKLIIPDSIKQLKNTVLVIDQVEGDMSIPYSLASIDSFNEMLEAAITENPNSDILVKTHPDVINGKRRGCINFSGKLPARVYISSDNLNPLRLLNHIEKTYVVSSQMGFEALMMDKPVICFGAPFYAGWGLTDDRLPKDLEVFQRRTNRPDLATVFFSAYFCYSNYFHPDTRETCELEEILDYVRLQYKNQKSYSGKLYCIGFSPWKKRFIKSYLKSPDSEVFFAKNASHAKQLGFDDSSKVCLWSSRYETESDKLHAEFHTQVWRIEDGFIRSVSLGSNYALPASLVIDKQGLYFNPQSTSDLEATLLDIHFNKEMLQAAERLKRQLIEQAISKYNVGARDVKNLFKSAREKRKLLVPGQVADDASILKGCLDIDSNISLLKTVRANHPDAYIIYKPHPDVLSGNRNGHVNSKDLIIYCDEVITDISLPDCLNQTDEVHTMTSLVGFEALMRGLKVYCYGIPFYSGWGLTIDRHQCERRLRKLSLNELIYATLIHYPIYINWETQKFTTAIHVSDRIHSDLVRLKKSGQTISTTPPKSWKWVRKKFKLLRTIFYLVLKKNN